MYMHATTTFVSAKLVHRLSTIGENYHYVLVYFNVYLIYLFTVQGGIKPIKNNFQLSPGGKN